MAISDQSIPQRAPDEWRVERHPQSLSIYFTTNTAQLRTVRMAIEEFCRDGGFDEKCWSEIGFVVNEAVANIIRHAYDAPDHSMPIDLTATLNEVGVTIDLRDWGHGKVPSLARAGARVDAAAAKGTVPEPGGVGLMCMKQLMNEISFIPQKPGMLLRLFRARQH
jgi:anti-sigma regulatory factor (Ser/Thr protein kinase)